MQKHLILSAFLALTALSAVADDLDKYKEESRAAVMPFMKALMAANMKAIARNPRSRCARKLPPQWQAISRAKTNGNSRA